MTPHGFPELFTKLFLGAGAGAKVSPGVVSFTGHDRGQDWDIQKAKGQTGASSVHNGSGVGQFQASFYLADEEEQDDWEDFRLLIESMTAGPEAIALPVFNVILNRNGFTEVSNGGVGGMVYDDRGGATVLVKFVELRPKKDKPSTTASGTGQSGGNAADPTASSYDPNADARRELAGLLEEASGP